mmetsp:Transcript_21452/g.62754  ORF Transcript_21452/g.62754 Transcript_21452/m.62754 type:complete len:196 (+) Transcript_21452:2245-2832(+)
MGDGGGAGTGPGGGGTSTAAGASSSYDGRGGGMLSSASCPLPDPIRFASLAIDVAVAVTIDGIDVGCGRSCGSVDALDSDEAPPSEEGRGDGALPTEDEEEPASLSLSLLSDRIDESDLPASFALTLALLPPPLVDEAEAAARRLPARGEATGSAGDGDWAGRGGRACGDASALGLLSSLSLPRRCCRRSPPPPP